MHLLSHMDPLNQSIPVNFSPLSTRRVAAWTMTWIEMVQNKRHTISCARQLSQYLRVSKACSSVVIIPSIWPIVAMTCSLPSHIDLCMSQLPMPILVEKEVQQCELPAWPNQHQWNRVVRLLNQICKMVSTLPKRLCRLALKAKSSPKHTTPGIYSL